MGTDQAAKPKRRWFQFSLRTMLVVMLVFGLVFAWIAAERQKNAAGQAHLDAIRKLGGIFRIENGESRNSQWHQMIFGDDSFRFVTTVILSNTEVTDTGLEQLQGLTQLEGLRLEETQITDAGLEHVKGMTRLKSLWLNNTQVTDVGLEHLKGLTQLKQLLLQNTQITDAAVMDFKKANPNCDIRR